MVSYNSTDVIQCLRQYDMFANSLSLVKNLDERKMIIKQLTKLEDKIFDLTEEAYEEEYYTLANKECGLLDDEKHRISMLVDLINQRLSYVEKRCNEHYQLTGESIDVKDVLGANTLDALEDKLKIIDKYSKNIKLQVELKEEIKSLTSKISLASEKIDINKSLNLELESKFKNYLNSVFEKLDLYDLIDSKDDIEYAYYETEKSLKLANSNFEIAKSSPYDILSECKDILDSVKEDYIKYKDKISLLELMNIFNQDVNTYTELLNKRNKINELFKYITNKEFKDKVIDLVDSQYSTILKEQQDINTFNDLSIEKERKLEALAEIEEENESEEFQSVLKVLIENEKKHQQKIMEEKRRIEEEEKKKKLEFERKKQEEILKRQRIIEDARKKEIEKRTKELLEQQQKSVLQTKKRDIGVSFETIKDISNNSNVDDNSNNSDNNMIEKDTINDNNINNVENKIDIEKDLFDEFNDTTKVVEEKQEENKLPDMSIDEYMKNFNESNVSSMDNIFDDDLFPSIPY